MFWCLNGLLVILIEDILPFSLSCSCRCPCNIFVDCKYCLTCILFLLWYNLWEQVCLFDLEFDCWNQYFCLSGACQCKVSGVCRCNQVNQHQPMDRVVIRWVSHQNSLYAAFERRQLRFLFHVPFLYISPFL